MLLLIDNYDSFTWNLVEYFRVLGAELMVKRNDALSVEEISALAPRGIVLSPGPGRPAAAGVSLAVVRELAARLPIFGVCLGMQTIAEACGGKIIKAQTLMHGKTSKISHDKTGVFQNLPPDLEAMRYHSLAVERSSLPGELRVNAETTDDHEVMGLCHASYPLSGVQFHPESIMTKTGKRLLRNFLNSLVD